MKAQSQLTIREALARFFPGGDKTRADEMIRWLDSCGYAIVDKDALHDEATLVPRPPRRGALNATFSSHQV